MSPLFDFFSIYYSLSSGGSEPEAFPLRSSGLISIGGSRGEEKCPQILEAFFPAPGQRMTRNGASIY